MVSADIKVVHTDNYDAVRIALPEASNFKYMFNITSYKGTEELARMFNEVCDTVGIPMNYDLLLQKIAATPKENISDDVYEDTTSDNLNSNVGTDNLLDSIIMASSDIDIDEDGRTEYCTITPGPTSGLFTVTITVFRENAIQYKNTFNLNWGEMKFGEKDGENYLIISRNGELQEYGVEYHKIYVESGRIVIDGLDPKYEGYWGGPDWNYDLK